MRLMRPLSATASLIIESRHSGVTNSLPVDNASTVRREVQLQAEALDQEVHDLHHIPVCQLVECRGVLHCHELLLEGQNFVHCDYYFCKLFRIAHELGRIIELGAVAALVEAELDVAAEGLLEAVAVADSWVSQTYSLPGRRQWNRIPCAARAGCSRSGRRSQCGPVPRNGRRTGSCGPSGSCAC
jgi:hypothetical protein